MFEMQNDNEGSNAVGGCQMLYDLKQAELVEVAIVESMRWKKST